MRLILLLSICFLSSALFARDSDPIRLLEQRVVTHTLKNGMKLLILERPNFPLVSYEMMFRVGGVDETSGKTGLAHLFEHMMFKGSKNVGTPDYEKERPVLEAMNQTGLEIMKEESKEQHADPKKLQELKGRMEELAKTYQGLANPEEFDQIYQQAGAEGLNAFTGKDMTGFVVSLPRNRWELWPLLESDRMDQPVLREFYKERDVVMEERRMRYESAPQGKLWEHFVAAAYMAHPYGSPTIGWASDIKKLTHLDAENFFKTHYAPNNAAVAIVGDIQAKEVIEKFEKYFSKVSSQTLAHTQITEEPAQEGERRIVVYFDSEPQLLLGFHKPNPPSADNFSLEMIEQILSRGRSSRFNRNIVEKKIALNAWASNGNPGERYANLIIFGGSSRKPHGNSDLENAVWIELEKLKRELVPAAEIEKIRNQVEADFMRNLASNAGLASQLSYNEVVIGDWKYCFQYLEGIRKVTPEMIRQTAQKVFTRKNSTVAYLERENENR